MSFEIIKKNYERGLWTKQMVRMAVGRVITKEEYQEITGKNIRGLCNGRYQKNMKQKQEYNQIDSINALLDNKKS